ncbi:Planctomycete cytochrome C [Caulifigura coniformis]|uniref:Planctomycete cytochrome C n=1 Tax=Caulifigura coniformis TaxID=2527983 RepID=A0A517SIN6_9PLAN|nr:PSD1 and planctomycete cytochrome C domain-containing protein [Caulifigura coniformis]QDT55993.1 Planctomycete cytochrome C [Caulifigura coniformis]
MPRLSAFLTIAFLATSHLVPAPAAGAERNGKWPVDFQRDIRPILAQNCFTCHGPDAASREAGLRLDRRPDAIGRLESGQAAIHPGHAESSELIRRLVADDSELMPPPETGRRLTPEQIDLLRRWVDSGAEYAGHWAYLPLTRPETPALANPKAARNEIDHFVLAALDRENLAPETEADRTTLIRRLSLDLTGLPPTAADVAAFLSDSRNDAYEQLVERLLSSPHFGERWGRHWLDLARYADSDGYLGDDLRPNAFRYRDWVIEAINRDLPFDQFTIEQIAGDLLPDATLEQQIATGFHRNSMKNTEAGADREEDRVNQAVDRVSTVGNVWLGLTVGCAQCHTHKYDPITHHEFYGLYAFFNNADDRDVSIPSPDQSRQKAALKQWTVERDQAEAAVRKVAPGLSKKELDSLIKLLSKSAARRDDDEESRLASMLEDLDEAQRLSLSEFEAIAARKPIVQEFKASTIAVAAKARETHVHMRGDFRSPGDIVTPGTPQFLNPLKTRGDAPDRLDLARWIVDDSNPLTARVAVNHVWKHLFGRGLVHPSDNFGISGEPPSHPELLDWLASEFRRLGWSRKELIRLIVTSATYRQRSTSRPEVEARDPLNVWLARQSRLRVEAEIVRDLALSVSGLLEPKVGGPSIRPALHARVTAISRNREWEVSGGSDRYRRGMYVLLRRATPYPMLTQFDAPDTTASCSVRERSNSPLQALTLLNDPVFLECARHFGERLTREESSDARVWIAAAFQQALSRAPEHRELDRLVELHREHSELISRLPAAELATLIARALPETEARELATRILMARTLMNLDEFITRE